MMKKEKTQRRSTSSWGSVERERELDEHFEEVKSPSVGSVDGREHVAGKEGKEENGQSPVARSEGEPAARGNVSSAKGGDTKGFHTDVSAVGLRDEGLGSSGLSVGSRCSEQHEPVEGRCNNSILPANESNAVAMNDESSCSDEREIKAVPDVKKKELQSQNNAQERISFDDVPELPLPLTTSPARPEPVLDSALPWSGGNLSDRSHESSISSRGQDGSIPTETASTLDSLVSLVVHSWEHDFFSESASEQREGVTPKKASDKPLAAANTPTQPNETHLPHVNEATDSSGVQCSSPVPNAEESYQASVSADNVDEQLNGMTEFEQHNEDDAEDSEVPGEEDDQIVQMLLERIALLEEALRQTDS
ncbi:hypothetical protein ON010_g5414 [Phytophthora cinnamomi]|nr:hypothetical protein ON010_g5414 [Phytophthora cinnamomi]